MRLPERNERGAVTVELVIVVPALVIMLGLLIAGGRIWFAKAAVTHAAESASRAASLARSAGEARTDARDAARASLATEGLTCHGESVAVDASGFAVAVGSPASVHATIRCTISFSDIVLPGLPGSMTVSRTETSALDTYRARS